MNTHVTAVLSGVGSAVVMSIIATLIWPPQVINVRATAPADVSPAKARLIAATTWPEMEQGEVDALTAAAKPIGGTVMIFCHEEAKCGDLALNLDNAFESAHWTSSVHMFQNLPGGMAASSKELAAMLNAATGGRFDVGVDPVRGIPGDYVAIGARRKVP